MQPAGDVVSSGILPGWPGRLLRFGKVSLASASAGEHTDPWDVVAMASAADAASGSKERAKTMALGRMNFSVRPAPRLPPVSRRKSQTVSGAQ